MKRLFKIPVYKVDDSFNLMYPKKHPVIREYQRRLNQWFGDGDRRRINHLMMHTNPHGQTYIFGHYGSRKNEIVVTIGQILAPGFIRLEHLEPVPNDI